MMPGPPPGVFVVACHIDGGQGAFQILFEAFGGRGGVILPEIGESLTGVLLALKAGGAEEDDGVLNLLAAEARQRFLIFRQDTKDAAVGAAEERFVLVGDRRGFEMISHRSGLSFIIPGPIITKARIAGYQTDLLLFVVVERLPETDPDIEQAQAAAQAAEEAVGDHITEGRKREQQIVVGPLRSPRKNDQQDSRHRTDQDEKKDGGAMHPDLQEAVSRAGFGWERRAEKRGARISRRGRGLGGTDGSAGKRCGVGHSGRLRRRGPAVQESRQRALRNTTQRGPDPG
jgi:hypothetical protein